MNQLKRVRSISESCDDVTNNFKGSRKSISCIENLPNELFYEIFDYFDGLDLYKTFSNLNLRFQHLLATSSLTFTIHLSSYCSEDFQYRYKHIIEPNRQRIISVGIHCIWDNTALFRSITINSSLSRLESLFISDIKLHDLLPCLPDLTLLPRLFSLTFDIDGFDCDLEDFGNIYQLIFSLTHLQYTKVYLRTVESFIPLTIPINNQFSNIEYLNIYHLCSLKVLIDLLSYTPRLCRLTTGELIGSIGNFENMRISLSNLTHISIRKCRLRFDIFEIFLKKICSQLQLLRITTYRDEAYLDADRWERLIQQHIPHLCRFHFNHQILVYYNFAISPYYNCAHRFNSSFWIERGWIFKLQIDVDNDSSATIIYSIHSDKKKWHDLSEFITIDGHSDQFANLNPTQYTESTNKEKDIMSSIQRFENMELNLVAPFYYICDSLFTDEIISLFTIFRITHLDISHSMIFIGTLIHFIRLLPNLELLTVGSLSLLGPRCLSVEEGITLRFLSNKNKIRKVNIRWMIELAELQFIFDLCPQIQYLEIDCSDNVNLKLLIRFILMKDIKYIPYLCTLCFRKLNDKTVEEMINFEKLCHDYTIKHIDDKIYLQWKR